MSPQAWRLPEAEAVASHRWKVMRSAKGYRVRRVAEKPFWAQITAEEFQAARKRRRKRK